LKFETESKFGTKKNVRSKFRFRPKFQFFSVKNGNGEQNKRHKNCKCSPDFVVTGNLMKLSPIDHKFDWDVW
jgi:hypothetical protein